MKNKIKNNKIKNTGIMFETLARQITADVLDESKSSSEAMQIVKKYFNKNSELRKELQLYQQLTKKNFTNESKASSFVDIIVQARKQLNNSKLRNEKYNIIKELRDTFPIDKLFSSKIDNYHVYASIYKLFEYSDVLNEVSNPEDLIKAKFAIVEFMCKGETKEKISDEIRQFQNEDKTVKLLTQQLLIEKFNEKYNAKLNTNQKELIRDYIHNVSNVQTLNEIISKHTAKILKEINLITKKIPDAAIKIKVEQIGKEIKIISEKKNIKDNYIVGILRTYELIAEIKKHMKQAGCSKKENVNG
jgi:hypothetical protein